MQEPYDLFVSYKAENANTVRTIVENLIAQGIRVWFAEYEILIENYDEFQDAIDAGIDRSRYFVAFTNQLWATKSEYCVAEVRRFLNRVPTGHLLEVGIPTEPHPRIVEPRLSTAPHLTYSGDDSEVLRFLAANTDLPIEAKTVAANSVRSNRWEEDRFGISLNLHGFLPASEELSLVQRAGWLCGIFQGMVERHPVRMAVFCSPFDPVIRTKSEPTTEIDDDRWTLREYREQTLAAKYRRYGHGFSDEHLLQYLGLHLVWVAGVSQMALSYVSQPAERLLERDIERRYVISVRDPLTKKVGEIGILFAVRVDAMNSYRETLARLAPTFDAIVQSIDYQPPISLTDPRNVSTIVPKFVVVTIAALVWKYTPFQFEYDVPIGLALGVSIGDLFHVLVSRKFLRLSTIFQETMYLRELKLGLMNGYTIIAGLIAVGVAREWPSVARIGWMCAGFVWVIIGGLKEANRRPKRKLPAVRKISGNP